MEKDPGQERNTDKSVGDVVYFKFEQDFIEKGIRCIPMIVRFKMDHVGIKLKLEEWTRFDVHERAQLAKMPIGTKTGIQEYYAYLSGLVKSRTGKQATPIAVDPFPVWSELDFVPASILEKVREFGGSLPIEKWRSFNTLQRFALVKLSREGHESKNFPIALKEFGVL